MKFEKFILNMLKSLIAIFSGESKQSGLKGNSLLNSSEAFDLYHNDFSQEARPSFFTVSEALWIFVLVLSFLKFVI